jgi:hypothetical protein
MIGRGDTSRREGHADGSKRCTWQPEQEATHMRGLHNMVRWEGVWEHEYQLVEASLSGMQQDELGRGGSRQERRSAWAG